ncbi:MAG: GNAT family N-acetyltransferase [Bacteroidota bacterium]
MKKAAYGDKSLVKNILAKSFDNNQSVNYIAQQDELREKRIAALMDYSFEICFNYGDVYLSDDNQACALVLYPDRKKTTFKSVLEDIKLLLNCIGLSNIGKAMKREAAIKKIQPNTPMYYLWFIGVDPESQGTGIGSRLMNEVIEDSRAQSRPIFLETSTERNLPWYKKFGFDIYSDLDLTYKLYFLKRDLA